MTSVKVKEEKGFSVTWRQNPKSKNNSETSVCQFYIPCNSRGIIRDWAVSRVKINCFENKINKNSDNYVFINALYRYRKRQEKTKQ